MEYIKELRDNLAGVVTAKENGRAAGSGMWANYVRAACWPPYDSPRTADAIDTKHESIKDELEAIRGLSKDEKNSLTSAKSVLKKAILSGVDVWRRTDDGDYEKDDAGHPIPRGKNDLQDTKSDYEKVLGMVDSLIKKMEADNREPFSKEELDTIAGRLLILAENVSAESSTIKDE